MILVCGDTILDEVREYKSNKISAEAPIPVLILKNRFFSKLPYFHILPRFIFQGILQLIGENKPKIKGMMEIYDTRITIDRLNRILKDNDYTILKKTDYLFNPNYETKFGIKPREQLKIISKIPFFRNFFITASYYLVSANK